MVAPNPNPLPAPPPEPTAHMFGDIHSKLCPNTAGHPNTGIAIHASPCTPPVERGVGSLGHVVPFPVHWGRAQ